MVCSAIFLYAYLSVFDWRLIWIIEYSDILKVGLVALGALFLVVTIVLSIVQVSRWLRFLSWYAASAGAISAALLATYFEWHSEVPRWGSHISFSAFAMLTLVVGGYIASLLLRPSPPTAYRIVILVVLLVVTAIAAGVAFGFAAKESRRPGYDVSLKDRELADLRLVLFTSHHTVLYSGGQLIILPTSEILKIVTHPEIAKQQ